MSEMYQFMDSEFQLAQAPEIISAIQSATAKQRVRLATLNPEFLLEARQNPDFQAALKNMTHCCVDGSGLFFCLKFWHWLTHKSLPLERYPGADLVGDLFKQYQQGQKKFFLLGGPVGQAEIARKTIQNIYPHIQIVGVDDGGLIPKKNIIPEKILLEKIMRDQPDILLVGFGMPKQELWIEAARQLPIPVMIGVGGTLGFYSTKKRAPRFLRTLHLEWIYRGLTEPGHWKRSLRSSLIFPLYAFTWMGKALARRGKV